MKLLWSLFFSFISVAVFSQPRAGIEYSPERDFHWGLFRGKVNPKHIAEMGKNTGAVTVSSLSYKTLEVTGKFATIRVTAEFHPHDSWTLYPKLSNPKEALNHEKRHFEITEIYARKIRQQILSERFSSPRLLNEEVNRLFKAWAGEHRAEQIRYDQETEHSLHPEEQVKWDRWIDSQLEALSDYADPVMTITFHQ